MSQKIDLSDPYFNDYHDRGIKKWNGFYLSEHTAIINAENAAARKTVPKKKRMTETEIGQVLEFAFNNRRQIVVQLEIVDSEGKYNDDTIGFIEGFDELGLMIGQEKVHYDEIRNIELLNFKKWSDMT
ncbi:hypothetical protein [Enterococcus sp. 5H]|uniref:hypothetical protein n=1 Tax=Enterococcus sp. 5H TaxID=1229490 RepID=UPI0023041861|nr:hypothetical protein [Enterococcus sp. 5H]MDA9471970.1 DNA-directed RNA polymerase beta subunit [Enterococcus sp. 5H]